MQDPWMTFWTTIAGSGIVAAVSIATLLIANAHTARIKRSEFDRNDLEIASSTVTNARAVIETMRAVIYTAELVSKSKNKSPDALANLSNTLTQRLDIADATLNRTTYLSPHKNIRAAALETGFALRYISDNIMTELLFPWVNYQQVRTAAKAIPMVQNAVENLAGAIYSTYYNDEHLKELQRLKTDLQNRRHDQDNHSSTPNTRR